MELEMDITFKDHFIGDYVTANYRLPRKLGISSRIRDEERSGCE